MVDNYFPEGRQSCAKVFPLINFVQPIWILTEQHTAVKSNRTWLFWHRSLYMVLPLSVFHIFWICLQLIHYNTSRNLLRMEMRYFNLQNATEMKSVANKKTRCFKRSSEIKSEVLEKVTIKIFYIAVCSLHPHG